MRIGVTEKVYVESVARKILTTLQKNAKNPTNVQTVVETTWYMQEFVRRWKKEKEILTIKYIKKTSLSGGTKDG